MAAAVLEPVGRIRDLASSANSGQRKSDRCNVGGVAVEGLSRGSDRGRMGEQGSGDGRFPLMDA